MFGPHLCTSSHTRNTQVQVTERRSQQKAMYREPNIATAFVVPTLSSLLMPCELLSDQSFCEQCCNVEVQTDLQIYKYINYKEINMYRQDFVTEFASKLANSANSHEHVIAGLGNGIYNQLLVQTARGDDHCTHAHIQTKNTVKPPCY